MPPLLIPPLWIPLADAPTWIEREFGIAADVARKPLIMAVLYDNRGTAPYHRVAIEPEYIGRNFGSLPRGFTRSSDYGPDRVIVKDWEAVRHLEDYSEIVGRNGANVVVELHWPSVAKWGESLRYRLRDAAFHAKRQNILEADTSVAAVVAKPKNVRPPPAAVAAWLLDYATKQMKVNGIPCKREIALKECRIATKCTCRAAAAAWAAVPANLRREARDTDIANAKR